MDRKKTVQRRDGRTLRVGIVTRISGGPGQQEISLEAQANHIKEVVQGFYDQGPVEYLVIAMTEKENGSTGPNSPKSRR